MVIRHFYMNIFYIVLQWIAGIMYIVLACILYKENFSIKAIKAIFRNYIMGIL